jgi:hypothetical protein
MKMIQFYFFPSAQLCIDALYVNCVLYIRPTSDIHVSVARKTVELLILGEKCESMLQYNIMHMPCSLGCSPLHLAMFTVGTFVLSV